MPLLACGHVPPHPALQDTGLADGVCTGESGDALRREVVRVRVYGSPMRALHIEFRIIETITVACGKSITGLYTAPAYANLAGPVHRTPGHHGPPRHTPRHDEGGAPSIPRPNATMDLGDCLQNKNEF